MKNKELDILIEKQADVERQAARRRAFQDMVRVLQFDQQPANIGNQELSLPMAAIEKSIDNHC